MSGLLACHEKCSELWALPQPGWLTFKIPNFRYPVWRGPPLVFGGRVLLHWDWCRFDPERKLHQSTGIKFGAKPTKETLSRLGTLSRHLCTHAVGQGREMVPSSYFIPGKAMPPLSDALQNGGTISSSVFQVIHRLYPLTPGYLPDFSTGSQHCCEGSIPAMPRTSETPVFEPPWLQKSQTHSFSHSIALGKCFPWVNPYVLLSLTSFQDQGPLPSGTPWDTFLFQTKFPIHTFYLSWCGLLSHSNCVVFSVSLQINLMGNQNDLLFIYSRDVIYLFKGWSKPRVLLILYHLRSPGMIFCFKLTRSLIDSFSHFVPG